MGPLCRGPVWMPITPKRGFFLHADLHYLLVCEEADFLAVHNDRSDQLCGHKAITLVMDRVHQVASVSIICQTSSLEGTKQTFIDAPGHQF